ncbi:MULTISPECIES: NAD(P)-dependent oxidoreductase [Streptomyces]|uniref:NAD(P)-binding domain-containing protein n=1 Tax=Streptomyces doudnae TaxID=3075536 RepID=A0ABD5EHY9_9ACTN|nr:MULTISPECIES: NAD(P)-binding domain-containing protein [unclassified Streptomyces]MDT0433389.1 NAD(P)-binding domain-containing protein [Streptomyces sp. DSM 41981]MYQ62081.1 NAD(P)-binding domain-containing protein [Streptomyces sp. SID4950]SCD30068.1 3-hydroxyisobutyrate dehydrogenase [Streptomyces sp. SolWspMP-5a-2]
MGNKSLTLIGLGPMGLAMVNTYLDNGYQVTVWNRTAAKAEPLVARGAVLAPTVEEALAANELVVLSLTDYDAVYAVLEPAAGSLSGKVIANLTSDTPEKAREAAAWAAKHGAKHLTGGVQVPPPLIGKPGSSTYYSGPKDVFDAHEEALKVLTEADHRGEDAGLAAMYYQAQMTIFWTSMLSFYQALALGQANGVAAQDLLPYAKMQFAMMPHFLDLYAQHVDTASYPGDVDRLAMGAASIDHVTHTHADAGVNTTLLDAVSAIFHAGMDKGFAENSFSSLIEILKKQAG